MQVEAVQIVILITLDVLDNNQEPAPVVNPETVNRFVKMRHLAGGTTIEFHGKDIIDVAIGVDKIHRALVGRQLQLA